MARRKFTREFKISAVKLVNEQGYSPPQAARSLGVDPASVREWVKKFSDEEGLGPTGEGAAQAELRRLRKENARRRGLQLPEALAHRRRGHPGCRHHRRHATPAERPRLRRSPEPPGSLIQRPLQRLVLVPDPFHNHSVWHASYNGTQVTNALAYFCEIP